MEKRRTITQLKQLFASNQVTEEMLLALVDDERKGVQTLIRSFQKEQERVIQLEKDYQLMCQYEHLRYQQGDTYVAGVDEAGRGPLAGPVVAAAVILPKTFQLLGLTDSKQLTAQKRETFYKIIKEQAISYGIGIISNQAIDRMNILEATKQAMIQAMDELAPAPDHVFIDAVSLNHATYTCEPIVKGDQKSVSIAAASILAKVTRDQIMADIHKNYPVYQFQTNKGYGTKQHLQMLKDYGVSPYHRISFAPVKQHIK